MLLEKVLFHLTTWEVVHHWSTAVRQSHQPCFPNHRKVRFQQPYV